MKMFGSTGLVVVVLLTYVHCLWGMEGGAGGVLVERPVPAPAPAPQFQEFERATAKRSEIGFYKPSPLVSGAKVSRKQFIFQNEAEFEGKFEGKVDIATRTKTMRSLKDWASYCFANFKEYSVKGHDDGSVHQTAIKFELLKDLFDGFVSLHKEVLSTHPERWIGGIASAGDSDLFNLNKPVILDDGKHLTPDFVCPRAEKVIVPVGSKIFICGDIHGSLHSLLRNLLRLFVMGYLKDDFTIAEQWKDRFYMVFLGDYVDRGRRSIEGLATLLSLKIKNKDRVFLLRGNHEDLNMNPESSGNSVKAEVEKKYETQSDAVKQMLRCFYDLLPMVLYLGCRDAVGITNYVQCCHGCIDPSYNPFNLLTDERRCYENLIGKQEVSNLLPEDVRQEAIRHFEGEQESLPLTASRFYAIGLSWGDVDRRTNSFGENVYSKDHLVFSRHGYSVSMPVIRTYFKELNIQLHDRGSNVLGLLRAHQHESFGVTVPYKEDVVARVGDLCHWAANVDADDLVKEEGFPLWKYSPVYTFLSAPEGVGHDNAHGIPVAFDYDSFGIMTVQEDEWLLKPYEYRIVGRSDNGIYCMVEQGYLSQDPLRVHFTPQQPTSNPLKYLCVLPQFDSARLKEIDEKTETMWQRRIHLKNKELKQAAALTSALEEAKLKVEMSRWPSLKTTQSGVHFKKASGVVEGALLINDVLMAQLERPGPFGKNTNEVFGYVPIGPFGEAQKKLVQAVLEREQQYADKYYVFYHACAGEFGILFDVYQHLCDWGMLRGYGPLAFRLPEEYGDGSEHIVASHTVDEFVNRCRQFEREGNYWKLGGTIQKDFAGSPSQWFDHIEYVKDMLLSVNLALFGNCTNHDESSWRYFNEGVSQNRIDVEKVLRNDFRQLKLDEVFVSGLVNLYREYHKDILGYMFQIFVKKDVIDKVGYVAAPGGIPFAQENVNAGELGMLSYLLNRYTTQPFVLTGEIEAFRHDGINNKFDYTMDFLQARLWLPAKELYDSSKTKIFKYSLNQFTDSDYARKEEAYQAKLAEQSEAIVRNFLRNVNMRRINIVGLRRKQLVPLSREVRAKDMEINFGTEDFAQSRQLEAAIENGRIDEVRNILRESKGGHLITRLSEDTTPLILSVKLHKPELLGIFIENAQETGQLREVLEARDSDGMTAWLLARQLGYGECVKMLFDAVDKASIKGPLKNDLLVQAYPDGELFKKEDFALLEQEQYATIMRGIFKWAFEHDNAFAVQLMNDLDKYVKSYDDTTCQFVLAVVGGCWSFVTPIWQKWCNIPAENKSSTEAEALSAQVVPVLRKSADAIYRLAPNIRRKENIEAMLNIWRYLVKNPLIAPTLGLGTDWLDRFPAEQKQIVAELVWQLARELVRIQTDDNYSVISDIICWLIKNGNEEDLDQINKAAKHFAMVGMQIDAKYYMSNAMLEVWRALLAKKQCFNDVTVAITKGIGSSNSNERSVAVNLWKALLDELRTLVNDGGHFAEAVAEASKGMESRDNFVQQKALELWKSLVDQGQFFKKAGEAAARGTVGAVAEVRQKALELWQALVKKLVELVNKGSNYAEAKEMAVAGTGTGDSEVRLEVLKLWTALFTKGQGFDEVKRIADEAFAGGNFNVKCSALELWKSLVDQGQFFEEAKEVAIKGIEDAAVEVGSKAIELWTALFTKGQGFDEAKGIADKAFAGGNFNVKCSALELWKNLVDQRHFFAEAKTAAVGGMETVDVSVKCSALKLWKSLVDQGQFFVEAKMAAVAGTGNYSLQSETLNLWQALVNKLTELVKAGSNYEEAKEVAVAGTGDYKVRQVVLNLWWALVNKLTELVRAGSNYEEAKEVAVAGTGTDNYEVRQVVLNLWQALVNKLVGLVNAGSNYAEAKEVAVAGTGTDNYEVRPVVLNLWQALVKKLTELVSAGNNFEEAREVAAAGTGTGDYWVQQEELKLWEALFKKEQGFEEVKKVLIVSDWQLKKLYDKYAPKIALPDESARPLGATPAAPVSLE